MSISDDKWIITPDPRPDARLRLLCFHHAGGGAFGFRSWTRLLHPDVELMAVQLPGRENRHAEAPISEAATILDALVQALRTRQDKPLALFGHSLGAVLAYLLARRIQNDGEFGPPIHLFVSASAAPRFESDDDAYELDRLPALSDKAVIKQIERLGGTPPEALGDGRLMQALVPTLRADMELIRRVRIPPGDLLQTALTILGGRDDRLAPRRDLETWRELTTHHAQLRLLPGGHFYSQTALPALVAIINAELAQGRERSD